MGATRAAGKLLVKVKFETSQPVMGRYTLAVGGSFVGTGVFKISPRAALRIDTSAPFDGDFSVLVRTPGKWLRIEGPATVKVPPIRRVVRPEKPLKRMEVRLPKVVARRGAACQEVFEIPVPAGGVAPVSCEGGKVANVERVGDKLKVTVSFDTNEERTAPFKIVVGDLVEATGVLQIDAPPRVAVAPAPAAVRPSVSSMTVKVIPEQPKGAIAPSLSLASLLKPKAPAFDVGTIEGKAGEQTTVSVFIPMPVEHRIGAKVSVKCGHDVLTVQEVRGSGPDAEVILRIDAKHSLSEPFQVVLEGKGKTVEAEGALVVKRPDPYNLCMATICGATVSESCPIKGEAFLEAKRFHAFFDPPLKEFSISAQRGTIEAGATHFPFSVRFSPQSQRPLETVLVVDCIDFEICVKVCGSISGFTGRQWGLRRH